MKFLVLDPRNGERCADLFVVDAADGSRRALRLGYVPEVLYDAAARELAVVDTQFDDSPGSPRGYWLKCYDPESLRLVRRVRTPARPMYAGYPGRSHHIMAGGGGRYLYVFGTEVVFRFPEADNVFRLQVYRYDRARDLLEPGGPAFESCMLDCGSHGSDGEGLYFHLSCDHPSTVAFGRFGSPGLAWVRLEELPPRGHCPQETCGSWFCPETQSLFCVTGEGAVYEVDCRQGRESRLLRLPLAGERSVPLHQLHGGGGRLFVGVAAGGEERGLGLASEVWHVSRADMSVTRVTKLPIPLINFVATPDGELLAGVNPHARVFVVLDAATGKILNGLDDLGVSPAEVQSVP
jgi:hypothetical protein